MNLVVNLFDHFRFSECHVTFKCTAANVLNHVTSSLVATVWSGSGSTQLFLTNVLRTDNVPNFAWYNEVQVWSLMKQC